MPEARINTGFRHFCPLFKLNGCRWLSCAVVHDTVDTFYFIDNPVGDFGKYFPWDLGGICGHEIGCVNRTQCNGVIVSTEVSHDSYRTHVGQGGKILAKAFIQSGFCDFLTVNGICFLYDLDFFLGNFANDTDAKTGTREGLTVYQVFGNAKLQSCTADLILKQQA